MKRDVYTIYLQEEGDGGGGILTEQYDNWSEAAQKKY